MPKKCINNFFNFGLILWFCFFIGCSQNSSALSQTKITIQPTPPLISANTIVDTDARKFYSASETCQKIKNDEERSLCNTIVKDQDLENEGLDKEFNYLINRIDLNGDGLEDAIIWIKDMCGSSGCPFSFYKKTKKGFVRIFDEFAWTPIILLNYQNNEWYDVAFQVAGGGVEPHYVILSFNGKTYKSKKTQVEQPEGKILLDKDWKQSVFGPIPNQ